MEIRLYFQMLKRGWWIILLTTLIALAAALGVSYLVTPQYTATAQFIITPGNVLATGNEVVQGLQTLDRQSVITTYVEVMNSSRIYRDSLEELQLRPDEMEDYSYEAVALSASSVLELNVTGPDPQLAAQLANSIGYKTIEFMRSLNQIYKFDFLDTASPPLEPSSPKPLLNAVLAVALGLIGGAVLTLINEQLLISFETFLQRARLDSVTGVYTNSFFRRLVEDEIAKKTQDIFSLCIVELSGLRDLIETLPAAVVENVLQRVTSILRRELRGNDVIGRWNGVSFVVMLPGTSGEAAARIFSRVFQYLSEPVELVRFETIVNLDVHIGGAEYGNDIAVDELFEKATSTLDQARRDSSNPVYVWEMKNPFWTEPELSK